MSYSLAGVYNSYNSECYTDWLVYITVITVSVILSGWCYGYITIITVSGTGYITVITVSVTGYITVITVCVILSGWCI